MWVAEKLDWKGLKCDMGVDLLFLLKRTVSEVDNVIKQLMKLMKAPVLCCVT
jgi:hypothetical protein